MTPRWPARLSVGLGCLSIVLAPPIGSMALVLYTLLEEPHPFRQANWGILAICVLVIAIGFAFPIANHRLWSYAKREEVLGRPRGQDVALVGLALTAVGPILLTAGVVLLLAGMIVGVIGLWITSLL